jgi:hypothetical protein
MAEVDFVDALGQRYTEGNVLDIIGNVFATPQHLVTAALPGEGDFMERFARGVEPSEYLPEDTSGVAKFAFDVVADPLNLLAGAGVVSKFAKAGKFSKAANRATKTGKSAIDELGDVLGRSKLRDEPIIDAILRNDPERVFTEFRKAGIKGVRKTDDIDDLVRNTAPEKLREIDAQFNTGGLLEDRKAMFEVVDHADDVFDSLLKGQADDRLSRLVGIRTARGRGFRDIKEQNKYIVDAAQDYLKRVQKERPDLFKKIQTEMEAKLGPFVGEGQIKAKFSKKFVEFATMIKLTGLSTHIRATVGNAFSTALRFPEKVAAGTVDAITTGITGGQRSVYAREALAEFTGAIKGLSEGGRAFYKTLLDPTDYLKEMTKAGESIGRHGAIEGKFGDIVRLPGRLIGAVDVFFKRANESADLYARATRTGLLEGRRGAELARRVTNIADNASPELKEFTKLAARERVFQEQLQGFMGTLNRIRGEHPLTRLIVPFFTTPVNLFKQSLQRVPGLGLAVPSTWKGLFRKSAKNWRAGKKFSEAEKMFATKAEFVNTMVARQITGGMFLGGAMLYAAQGNISSLGPKSKSQRSVKRLSGWQPLSIKIGDRWFGFRGFEPISSWLRTAADAFEGIEEKESGVELSQKMIASYVRQFAENPFFMGIHDMYEAFSNPEANASDVVSGMVVGSTIPNILQQMGRVWDPVIREPTGTFEKAFARVPVLSQTVSPLRDIFGEPVERDIPWANMVGFNISVKSDDKVNNELARLGIGIGKPTKTVNGVELTDEEYERFYILKGQMLKDSLKSLVEWDTYERLDDEERIDFIRSDIRRINSFAKSQTFERYYQEGSRQ